MLELDIDGVFKFMLLLKKKKYAAMTIEKRKVVESSRRLEGVVTIEKHERYWHFWYQHK